MLAPSPARCGFLVRLALGAIVSAALSTAASAETYVGTGAPLPDGAADGTPGVFSNTVNVPDSFTVGTAEVQLTNIFHPYLGDLIATLTGPDGSSSTMFHRIGLPDQHADFGDSSNLGGTYTITDTAAVPLAAAARLVGNEDIAPGPYRSSAADELDTPTVFSLPFVGDNSMGDWTLMISDNGNLDTGIIGGWSLILTPVIPEPSALALMGIGGLLLVRRRRA